MNNSGKKEPYYYFTDMEIQNVIRNYKNTSCQEVIYYIGKITEYPEIISNAFNLFFIIKIENLRANIDPSFV